MAQIDTLDEQIIDALQRNGRLTMKGLAEQVGLSSPAMIERVRRLEERGVITGYRATVQPAALGRAITAIVMADVSGGNYAAFLERVRAEPGVVECYRVAGDVTHVVKVHMPDVGSLEVFIDALSVAGARCRTSVVTSTPVMDRAVVAPSGTAKPRSRSGRRAGSRPAAVPAPVRKPARRRAAATPPADGSA